MSRETQNQLHSIIGGLKSSIDGNISGREVMLNTITEQERKQYRIGLTNPDSPSTSQFSEGTTFRGSVNQQVGNEDRDISPEDIDTTIINPKIREYIVQLSLAKTTIMETWSPVELKRYTSSAEQFAGRLSTMHLSSAHKSLDRFFFDILIGSAPSLNGTLSYDISNKTGLEIKQDIFVPVNALLNGNFISTEATFFNEEDLIILVEAQTFDKVWDTSLEAGAGSDKQQTILENGMNTNTNLKGVSMMRVPSTILSGVNQNGILWVVMTIGIFGTMNGNDDNELFVTPTPRTGDFMDIYDWYNAGYTSVFPEFTFYASSLVALPEITQTIFAINQAKLFHGKSLIPNVKVESVFKEFPNVIAALDKERTGAGKEVLDKFSKSVQDAVKSAMKQSDISLDSTPVE